MMLRVGYSSFVNLYPIFWHLRKNSNYRFVSGVPSALNTVLSSGQLDVSPVSSLEYMHQSERYRILDGIGICANKYSQSVLLCSDYPIEDLNGKNIFLTEHSLTSASLLKLLFDRFYNISPVYVPKGQAKDAYLIIGDDALKVYHNSSSRYVYDLAELWHKFTGLPFVFSLWLVSANTQKNQEISVLHNEIKTIVTDIPDRAGFYADEFLLENESALTKGQLVDYWRALHFTLNEDEMKGVETFFKLLGYEPQWYFFKPEEKNG